VPVFTYGVMSTLKPAWPLTWRPDWWPLMTSLLRGAAAAAYQHVVQLDPGPWFVSSVLSPVSGQAPRRPFPALQLPYSDGWMT
jgi:hypothetical protein